MYEHDRLQAVVPEGLHSQAVVVSGRRGVQAGEGGEAGAARAGAQRIRITSGPSSRCEQGPSWPKECKPTSVTPPPLTTQALCSTHARECEEHCKEEVAAADTSKKGGGSSKASKQAVETCKWRCTLSGGSPCLAVRATPNAPASRCPLLGPSILWPSQRSRLRLRFNFCRSPRLRPDGWVFSPPLSPRLLHSPCSAAAPSAAPCSATAGGASAPSSTAPRTGCGRALPLVPLSRASSSPPVPSQLFLSAHRRSPDADPSLHLLSPPQCVPRLPLSARLPRELGICLAPFSDPRFHLASRSEPTFLDLQHNRTIGALVQFAQQQGVLSGPLSPTDQLDLPSAGDFATVGTQTQRAPSVRMRTTQPLRRERTRSRAHVHTTAAAEKGLIPFSSASLLQCAVVGSSDSLIGSGLGPAIDAHTAVFRFNDAPTRGFANDVGSRTTIRIQNSMTCGWHEFGGEMCVHYTSEPGSECKNELLPWWRDCGFVRLSSRMLEYVKRFFFDDSVAKGNQRDTSAGFFGTVLALHLCGKVDIYGFTQRSGHYFEKLDRSKARTWRPPDARLRLLL